DVPETVWFRLGRPLADIWKQRVLLSWTGTMFEYLMPHMWHRTFDRTLLAETLDSAVNCQQLLAAQQNLPWGISECAYSDRDPSGVYAYQAFGVQQLAISREHSDRIVIAPYATFLALPVAPDAAIENLRRLQRLGAQGEYGLSESVDFGPGDEPASRTPQVVRCWMAHHLAMSLMSIANLLCDDVFARLFHCEPQVVATERLLQELMPAA